MCSSHWREGVNGLANALVQKSSTLVVEHSFYRRFQLKNTCKKKSADPTQKPLVETHFHCVNTNGAFPLAVLLKKPPVQMKHFH
jgi:hypothetical protein